MSLNNITKSSREENEQLLLTKRNGATITPKKGATLASIESDATTGDGEKTAFLTTEPVRLTPAWEAVNVPDDELNFRTLSLEEATLEMNPPSDKYNLVYFTILLHGIGILTSWNTFITAKEYFAKYKLGPEYTGEKLSYATNFLSFIGFAAQVPNVALNWMSIFVRIGGSPTKRIVFSLTILCIVFLFTIILAMADTSNSAGAFFWLTMISILILNSANGIYQSTIFGLAARLPFKYSGVLILGCNMSGTLTTIISIATNQLTSNQRIAGIYYFITALFILLVCFDTYFALPLNRFYRYQNLLNEKEANKADNQAESKRIPYWTIYKRAFVQLFNLFFTYFVTLAVFPTIHSDIKSSSPDFFIQDDQLYTLITCYLTFNVCATIGSLLTSIVTWPKPQYLIYFVVLRIVYIPLFILMKYQPMNITRNLPVLINNDWAYWLIAISMSLTSGYFGALSVMYVPRTVELQHSGIAGQFASAMLVTGIMFGVLFSFLGPVIVEYFPGFTSHI